MRALVPCLLAVALASAASTAAGTAEGVDALVTDDLRRFALEPAPVCSDAVFVRRVYLDVIGTLPTAQEARSFLADRDPAKRAALLDVLLSRPEFADYWAMKWSDVLRVKSEFPINLWPNAVQAYHRWIRASLAEHARYDLFAREALTASGSNFRVPPVNFYRALPSKEPEATAQAVALTFLGMRAERWPKERLAGMARFFGQIGYKPTAEWKEEIVFFDIQKAVSGEPVFPDGTRAHLRPGQDPREVFADWLIAPANPWFARAAVNRVWFWLFGRGLVHEADDLRDDNPPVNPQLLAYLEHELVRSGYDLRHLYRLILTSQTYQRSSGLGTGGHEAARRFARYPVRRLEAEVLIDALGQVTGTTEPYSSLIPEPYTFVPAGTRAIALADGSVTSPFLDTFGRPPRDTGQASERNDQTTAAQRLHLLNSSHVHHKLEQSPLPRALALANGDRREAITDLYLTVLSRPPSEDERQVVRSHLERAGNRREAAVDVLWALVNSAEFLHRH